MMPIQGQGEGRDYRVHYLWAGGVALFALAVLGYRLYSLQISRGDYYSARSLANFVKEVEVPADRGMILDLEGRVVVDERPAWAVEITPAFAPDARRSLDRLRPLLGLSHAAVDALADRLEATRGLEAFRAVTVAQDVPREVVDWIGAHNLELDGVDVKVSHRRNYRYGTWLAHTLGHMGEIGDEALRRARDEGLDYRLGDQIGQVGLERIYEATLRGRAGLERRVVDAKGRALDFMLDADGEAQPLIAEGDRRQPSVPGQNLVLTVDMTLQAAAERAFTGRQGALVAIDPRDGRVRALVSRPGFDPNPLAQGLSREALATLIRDPYKPLLNRAINEHYPPGSTFKPVTALAALEAGVATPHSGISCRGGYQLGRRRWRCWSAAGHGHQQLEGAMQRSCDTYFYWLSDKMGIEPIASWSRRFGFGQPTGFEVGREQPGIVPDEAYYEARLPEGYQHGLALNTSIGQGDVNVTPMQLAVAYAALANGGRRWVPQIVERVEGPGGEVVRPFEPKLAGELKMDPAHRAGVIEGLRKVVMEPGGTAYYRRPKGLGIEIAGKTGTAQVVRIEKVRLATDEMEYFHRDHAWFAAFAPVEAPELVVVVVNEHGGHGSSGAAPAAMAFIEAYFKAQAPEAG